MMKFDLHSHSHFSDGTLSPTELVRLAVERDVTHLALTDHDTINGLREAQLAAEGTRVTIINGVELSCTWENQLIHIVGLDIDPHNRILKTGLEQNRQRRLNRAESMYEDFEQHDIFLRKAVLDQLNSGGVPTRPHFAQALIDQGYAKNKKQAFSRYLVRGKPGYIPLLWPDLTEVGHWVRSAGGVAVLAHPIRYKMTRAKLVRLVSEMIPAGVFGIEVSTPTTDPQQARMLAELSRKFKLYASLGSDFHSLDQPWARLGNVMPLSKDVMPVWSVFDTEITREEIPVLY